MPHGSRGFRRGGGGGPSGPAGFTDEFSISIKAEDTNALPTDDATFEIALDVADSNAGHSEAVSLTFPAGVWVDTNVAPSDTQDFTMRVWLSGSSGSGVTGPSSADGENDGTFATVSTNIAGANPEVLTSDLGINVPAGLTLTSVIYRGWFTSNNTLVTSTGELVMTSIGSLFSDIVMFSNSGLNNNVSHAGGTFTFDLIAAGVDTSAKLSSCEMVHRTTDLAAGVTPHVLSVDAGALEISGAF